MTDMLEVTHHRQHRKDSFNDHAHIPDPPFAHFHVRWVALPGEKAMIGQDDHLIFEPADQGMKNSVINVGRGTLPARNQPKLVQDAAQFASHDPKMIGQSLLFDPQVLWNVSFQLSDLVTLGLFLYANPLTQAFIQITTSLATRLAGQVSVQKATQKVAQTTSPNPTSQAR